MLSSGFCPPSENKRKGKERKVLGLCQRTKKPVEHGDDDTNCNSRTWNVLQRRLEELEIGGRAETIQTIVLLRSDRILARFLETWEDLLSLRIQWENLVGKTVIIIIIYKILQSVCLTKRCSIYLYFIHFLRTIYIFKWWFIYSRFFIVLLLAKIIELDLDEAVHIFF